MIFGVIGPTEVRLRGAAGARHVQRRQHNSSRDSTCALDVATGLWGESRVNGVSAAPAGSPKC